MSLPIKAQCRAWSKWLLKHLDCFHRRNPTSPNTISSLNVALCKDNECSTAPVIMIKGSAPRSGDVGLSVTAPKAWKPLPIHSLSAERRAEFKSSAVPRRAGTAWGRSACSLVHLAWLQEEQGTLLQPPIQINGRLLTQGIAGGVGNSSQWAAHKDRREMVAALNKAPTVHRGKAAQQQTGCCSEPGQSRQEINKG